LKLEKITSSSTLAQSKKKGNTNLKSKIKLGKISRSKKTRAIKQGEGQGATKKYHKVPKTRNKITKIIKGTNE
jgi:hypothetical protein